jgi:hypothetical protein
MAIRLGWIYAFKKDRHLHDRHGNHVNSFRQKLRKQREHSRKDRTIYQANYGSRNHTQDSRIDEPDEEVHRQTNSCQRSLNPVVKRRKCKERRTAECTSQLRVPRSEGAYLQ